MDLKSSMSKVAETLAKFALLEERHQQIAATTNRILERIEKMEERQRLSEVSHNTLGRLFDNIDKQAGKIEALERTSIEDKARTDGAFKTIRVLWVLMGGLMMWAGSRILSTLVATPILSAPILPPL